MKNFFNRNTGLVLTSLTVIAILGYTMVWNFTKEKPIDIVRIKQTVDYNGFMTNNQYFLKTEVFINDKLTISDTDMGTYQEIDSIKCIRYKEIKEKADNLYKLRNKKCN